MRAANNRNRTVGTARIHCNLAALPGLPDLRKFLAPKCRPPTKAMSRNQDVLLAALTEPLMRPATRKNPVIATASQPMPVRILEIIALP